MGSVRGQGYPHLNPQAAPKLLALGSPALWRSGPGRVPPTHRWGVGAGHLRSAGTQQSLGSEASTAPPDRLHLDPGKLLLPANLTSPKPLLGVAPHGSWVDGRGRSRSRPSSPLARGGPSALLSARTPAACPQGRAASCCRA